MSEKEDKYNPKEIVQSRFYIRNAQICIFSVIKQKKQESFFTSFNKNVTIINNNL